MKFSLKRVTTIAGVTCAILGTGPIALAGAATPGMTSAPAPAPLFPGLSCSVNQGLFPGIPNLGPTGPLGPLGANGPGGGGSNNNLPCGASAFNLGPSGPLGPGGALGGNGSKPAPTTPTSPTAPKVTPVTPAPKAVSKGHTKKHATHKRAHHKVVKKHVHKA